MDIKTAIKDMVFIYKMSRIEDELNKLVVENPEYLRTLIQKLDIQNRIKNIVSPPNPNKPTHMIS